MRLTVTGLNSFEYVQVIYSWNITTCSAITGRMPPVGYEMAITVSGERFWLCPNNGVQEVFVTLDHSFGQGPRCDLRVSV